MFNTIFPKGTTTELLDEGISEFKSDNFSMDGRYELVHLGKANLKEIIRPLPEGGIIRKLEAELPQQRIPLNGSITYMPMQKVTDDFMSYVDRSLWHSGYRLVLNSEFKDDFQPPLFHQLSGELYWVRWNSE